MKNRFATWQRAGLAGAFFGAILLGFAGTASAQGVVRSSHGDWQMRCDDTQGPGVDICALMQSVTAKDNKNIGITIIIQKHKGGKVLLRAQTPLGVLLPGGLGLQVDGKDLGRTIFLRCLPSGCLAEVPLDKKVLSNFRAGAKATFVIFESPKKGIGLPVSLKGFTAGYESLPIMGTPAKVINIKPGVSKPVAQAPAAKAVKKAVKDQAKQTVDGNVSTTVKSLPLPGMGSPKNESRLMPSGAK